MKDYKIKMPNNRLRYRDQKQIIWLRKNNWTYFYKIMILYIHNSLNYKGVIKNISNKFNN